MTHSRLFSFSYGLLPVLMGDYPEFPPAFVLRDPQGVRDFGSDTLEDLVHAVVLDFL